MLYFIRLKFGPDGKLYISTCDTATPNLSQDIKSMAGKVLRLKSDGSITTDNPFSDSPVYSYGHRYVEGLAWNTRTKQLYAIEESGLGTDEINLMQAVTNYGWPNQECNSNDRKFEALCSVLIRRSKEQKLHSIQLTQIKAI